MNNNKFYWPLKYSSFMKIGRQFNENYFDLVNSSDHQTKSILICIYGCIFNEFNAVVCNLYILNSRKEINYQSLFHNKKSRIFRNLTNEEYNFPSIVNTLKYGLSQNFVKEKLHALKFKFIKKFPNNASLNSLDLQNDILCIHTSNLIDKNYESKKKKIFYVPLSEWFKPIKENYFFMSSRKLIALCQNVENIIVKILKNHKLTNNHANNYFKKLIDELLFNTNKHIGNILEKKISAKKLWTGSGGAITTRILRLTCMLNNGYVVGHDHSHGQGPFINLINTLIELPFLNEFVTRSNRQKMSIQREMLNSFIKFKNLKIKVLLENEKMNLKKVRKKYFNKKILFVSSIYNIDSSPLDPLPFIPILLDFELRLFNLLKRKGFQPIYKPHPENKLDVNEIFEQNGYEVLNQRFEEIFEDMGSIIFAIPSQTSFFNAMKTDIPIIMVDLGFKKWDNYALRMLKKRVGYVPTVFDNNNRILFKEHQLLKQIEASLLLNDNTFAKNYFYPTISINDKN